MYELIIFCCNCVERGKDKKKTTRQPLSSPGLHDGARNKSWAARLAPSNIGVGAALGRAGVQDPASSCAPPLSWDTRRWNCPNGISCALKWDLLPRAAAAQGTLCACGFLSPPPCTRWCFYKSLGFTEPQRVRPSPAELQAAALRAGTLRTHPAAHTAAFFLHLCNRDDKPAGRRGSGGKGGSAGGTH